MAIGGIVLLIFGLNFLKGLDLFKGRNVFHAVYSDVSGINDATPVLFHGYKVGQVISTEMLPDGSGRIDVSFQIDEHRLKLTKDTRVEIFSADLFSRAVQVIIGNGPLAVPGDTLVGNAEMSLTQSVSAQIDPLKRKAEGMLASVDSVLSSLQLILNENARGDIDASFTNLRATMENINSTTKSLDELINTQSKNIGRIISNLDTLTSTFTANRKHMDNIFTNMDSVSAALANGRLERMMSNLESTSKDLKSTMEKINSGQGTLGKLMTDDSLYHNLNTASHQMDLLLEDVRLNPHRYLSIFGRKDKLPKLSGSDIERIREAYPPTKP